MTAVYCGTYNFMSRMAQPTYAADGTLLDGGIDLNMKEGMAEYVVCLYVVVVITTICQLPLNFTFGR